MGPGKHILKLKFDNHVCNKLDLYGYFSPNYASLNLN